MQNVKQFLRGHVEFPSAFKKDVCYGGPCSYIDYGRTLELVWTQYSINFVTRIIKRTREENMVRNETQVIF